eukprot:243287-Chlamydomonas_euryale.AAC.2
MAVEFWAQGLNHMGPLNDSAQASHATAAELCVRRSAPLCRGATKLRIAPSCAACRAASPPPSASVANRKTRNICHPAL